MPKYRKKPVEVEAIRVTRDLVAAHLFDGGALPPGLRTAYAGYHGETRRINHWRGVVTTIHDDEVTVDIGDWIVSEREAERWYPVKSDIFAATYEPA